MNIYRLRVELTQSPYDEGEGTWRIIEMRGNQNLHQLHGAIFRAFDRWEHHLYSFFMSANRKDHASEYASPDYFEDEEWEEDLPRNARIAKLDSLGLTVGSTFEYIFDYGDDWEHRVKVLRISDEKTTGRYPRMIEGRGASPPQYPVPRTGECAEDFTEEQPIERARIIPLFEVRE